MIELRSAGVEVLDCEHRTPPPVADGYPYIAIPDLRAGRVDLSSARRISHADLLDWTRRTKPRTGDVLVTRRGRVGDTAVIPPEIECAIGQNLVILRSDSSQVDPSYLRWATRSPQWFREVSRLTNVGAVFSSLNVSDISRIRIPAPQRADQLALAGVLGALDDKIAANAELARTADDLSGAYYSQMLGDANDRPLSSIASFTNGRAFTKGVSGTGRVVVRIAELNSGIGPSTVRSDAAVADQYTARPGDILFAWSGSLTVNRWYRPEAIVNQHIFKVEPVDGFPRWLVFRALRAKLAEFRNIAADKATTMGHIQRYHLDDAVSLPDHPEIGARDALMTALWNRALAAEKESLALTELRDTLLPHLMSGRLTVRDAEKTVSDAV